MSTSSKNKNSGEAEKISIGYVSAAHGVRGAVRLVPLTDFPERFRTMDFLELYSEGRLVRRLRVTQVREHESKGGLIIESDDVPDRDEAEKLVGTSVLIAPEERVPLDEGHFWVDDLIGLSVVDGEENVIGVVEDFLSSGGYELYAVKDRDGRLRYIPAVEEFVKSIDLASGKIAVRLIEGL